MISVCSNCTSGDHHVDRWWSSSWDGSSRKLLAVNVNTDRQQTPCSHTSCDTTGRQYLLSITLLVSLFPCSAEAQKQAPPSIEVTLPESQSENRTMNENKTEEEGEYEDFWISFVYILFSLAMGLHMLPIMHCRITSAFKCCSLEPSGFREVFYSCSCTTALLNSPLQLIRSWSINI